jgi:hypothetical protein
MARRSSMSVQDESEGLLDKNAISFESLFNGE